MIYTVTINDKNTLSHSLVEMLKALSLENNFLKIDISTENSGFELSKEQEKELEERLEFVKKNPYIGKTWEEIETSLKK